MKYFVVSIALLLISFSGLADVEKANVEEGIMRFEYRIINRSSKAETITFYLSLPQDNERQEIQFLYPEPGYKKIKKDRYGNRIAVYVEKNMQPGEVRTHGWMAHVKMYAAVYEKYDKKQKLKKKRHKLYLMDKENYRINDPNIRKLRHQIVRKGDSDFQKAMAIYKYLINNIEYYRDDKWEPAPDILKNRKGSCSEFNYTLVSLLRASGIPARYTGSLSIRQQDVTEYDGNIHEDAVFHRWTEVFTPDYGWIPFDASRGSGSIKRFGNYYDLVGRLPSGALQTYRGDGGADNMLKWDYTATARSNGEFRDIPVAYYIPIKKEQGNLEARVKEITGLLKSGTLVDELPRLLKRSLDREVLFFFRGQIDPTAYPALVKGLLKVGHPSAIYFSLLAHHRNIQMPYLLNFALFSDAALKKHISRYLNLEKWDWQLFEYWWRKARPFVKFCKKSQHFVLTKQDINIY